MTASHSERPATHAETAAEIQAPPPIATIDDLLDALIAEIGEALTEADVDYPAGRDCGHRITFDDGQMRAGLLRALKKASLPVAAGDDITITKSARYAGAYAVHRGDRSNDGLGWDEMLGLVISLTFPFGRVPLYPMNTEAERRAEEERRAQLEQRTWDQITGGGSD